jgi:sec-independent protein translocase protein TatC
MGEDEPKMTLGEHLEELRGCLLRALIAVLVGMIACFVLRRYLWAVISWPLAVATLGNPPPMQAVSPPEGFSTLLKLCLVTGAIVSSPYGLYQMWKFIGAGLYEHERRAIRRYLLPSVLLFALGVLFFFAIVAPLVLRFFLFFNQENYRAPPDWMVDWVGKHIVRTAPDATGAEPQSGGGFVESRFRVTAYVSFVAGLSLVFGLGFQTPLVVLFLTGTGLVPIEAMRSFRRYVVLVMLIVAAFITPPDWVSMIALAGPMYLLYEIGLVLASLRRRRKAA